MSSGLHLSPLERVQALVEASGQEASEALRNVETEQLDEVLLKVAELIETRQFVDQVWFQALCEARALRGADGLSAMRAWLATHGESLGPAFVYRVANRVAWISRGLETEPMWRGATLGDLFTLYVGLSQRRFFFDVRAMDRILSSLPDARLRDDPVVCAMQAFVTIRDATDSREVRAAARMALNPHLSPEIYLICADIVAHSVWLNHDLQEQGIVLEEVCRDWLDRAGRASPVMQFRFAAALRLQGRYAEAIVRVEDALGKLRGSTEFVRTFSEQCLRERELSVAGLSLQRSSDETRVVLAELEVSVQQSENRSTARTIEIITLFSAVASFGIAGGAAASSGSGTAKEKLVVLAGFGSALATFTLLVILVMVVSSSAAQARRLVGLGLGIAVIIGAQFGLAIYASHLM